MCECTHGARVCRCVKNRRVRQSARVRIRASEKKTNFYFCEVHRNQSIDQLWHGGNFIFVYILINFIVGCFPVRHKLHIFVSYLMACCV